jgi:hypothetical protein
MIALIDPCKRGELHFQFLNGYSLFCSVFVASGFLGQPVETAGSNALLVRSAKLAVG